MRGTPGHILVWFVSRGILGRTTLSRRPATPRGLLALRLLLCLVEFIDQANAKGVSISSIIIPLQSTYFRRSVTSTSSLPFRSPFFDLRLVPGFSFRKIKSTSSGKPGHSRFVLIQFWQAGRVSSHYVPVSACRLPTSPMVPNEACAPARTLIRLDLQVRQPREGRPKYTYKRCISMFHARPGANVGMLPFLEDFIVAIDAAR